MHLDKSQEFCTRRIYIPLLVVLLPRVADADQLFQGGVSFSMTGVPLALVMDDFDLDGRLDAAALSTDGVSVLRGRDGRTGDVFAHACSYDAGPGPISLASGDLNGDRFPDLVAANGGASTLSILLNQGDGTFAVQSQVPVGLNPRVVELVDLSGDDHLDAVTSNLQSHSVDVLLGDGRGGLKASSSFVVGDNPHALLTGDFDGDAAPDLVVAHSGAVTWFQGRGDGSFGASVDTPLFPDPRVLAAGDANADGRPDLAVITDERNLIHLENRGQGAFHEEAIDTLPRGNIFEHMVQAVIVDFTADGLADVLAVISGPKDARLQVYANDGNGSFADRDAFFLSSSVNGLVVEDLDADGTLDAVSARADAAQVVYFHGTGPGRLSTRLAVPLEAGPRDILPFDVDRDGAVDLVALSSDAYWVLKRDGRGGFEPPQAQKFPGSAFQDIAAGDFNGDKSPELVLADLAGNKVIIAFLENGAFSRSVEHVLLELPAQIVAADLDGDSLSDLAVTDQAALSVLVLFRAGDAGSTARVEVAVGASQAAVTAADFDGDGAVDLALAARDGARIFFGDGARGFPRSLRLDWLASSPSIRAADIDADGAMDLIGVARSKLVVLHSVAAAGAPRVTEVDLGSEARPLEVFDVDADGTLDLVTATASALNVARGVPAGFAAPESYAVGSSPRALALGDFNGDSWVDAATADFGDRSLSLLQGTPRVLDPSFRRGDADLNGAVNVTDAARILAALFLGAGPLACPDAADVNDDGALSLTDAMALLLHLFQGGAAPPLPGTASCGQDPSLDGLDGCRQGCE